MSTTVINYRCPNCGHSDRIHRKLDGCMTRVDLPTGHRRWQRCKCPLKPDAIRLATTETLAAASALSTEDRQ